MNIRNLAFLLVGIISTTFGQAQKNDTRAYDVISYQINLNITDFEHETISGNTVVTLQPESSSLKSYELDLAGLETDSILNEKGQKIEFSQKKEQLLVKTSLNSVETIRIFYHGKPIKDAAWGGFFFDDSVAFNMGVGMASVPHSYARVWFPCKDDFADKAEFEFNITTTPDMKAVCSGTFQDSTVLESGLVNWHWTMDKPVSPYIVNVAVGKYQKIEKIYKGIKRNIPIEIFVRQQFYANAQKSFINLRSSLHTFETHYGEYVWDKVGYVGVPFTAGAMEHVCNISYPEYAIDGTKNRETLMAHELSHHWFGNLVTCKTSEDMWLNEGWASFSEALFTEYAYDKDAYKKYVRNNHIKVLQFTHQYDNGYRAVYGIPKEYTYGSTVYDKGADVAHTLRGYMGDSLFFSSLTAYIEAFAYKSADTYDFRNFLSKQSGIDLTDFFESWVFTPGFPHFSSEIVKIKKSEDKYQTEIKITQTLKERSLYSKNNKVDIDIFDDAGHTAKQSITFSGEDTTIILSLDFEPKTVFTDMHEKIADATVDTYKNITKNKKYVFDYCGFTAQITNFKDSGIMQTTLNFIPPNPYNSKKHELSKIKYWTIKGAGNFTSTGNFYVNAGEFNLTEKISNVTLLYKAPGKTKWQPVETTMNKKNDYEAFFVVKNLKFGDYAVGTSKK